MNEPQSMAPYRWCRTEDVLVTCISLSPDGADGSFLIQRTENVTRTSTRGAFVASFDEDRISVNGLYIDLNTDWPEVLCALADAVALAPDFGPGQAATTRYEV